MQRFASASVRSIDTCARHVARRLRWTGPYLTLFYLLAAGLLVLSASRLGLVIWQWDRVQAAGIVATVFIQGVRADLILLGYLLVPPLACVPLAAFGRTARWWRAATAWWVSLALVFIVFMELASPQFVMPVSYTHLTLPTICSV